MMQVFMCCLYIFVQLRNIFWLLIIDKSWQNRIFLLSTIWLHKHNLLSFLIQYVFTLWDFHDQPFILCHLRLGFMLSLLLSNEIMPHIYVSMHIVDCTLWYFLWTFHPNYKREPHWEERKETERFLHTIPQYLISSESLNC